MSPFTGAIPVNQINSLPLLSTSDLAFGGTVSVIGGAINRYFSPAQTGINGQAGNLNTADADPSGAGAGYSVISNLLDVRGCTRFSALAAIKMPAADEDAIYSLNLRIASPVAADLTTAIPPRTGTYGTGAWPLVAAYTIGVSSAGAFPAYKTAGKGWMVGGRDPAAIQSGSMGFIYLWFNFNHVGVHFDSVLFVSLYATS
jgi:hypothetical protein